MIILTIIAYDYSTFIGLRLSSVSNMKINIFAYYKNKGMREEEEGSDGEKRRQAKGICESCGLSSFVGFASVVLTNRGFVVNNSIKLFFKLVLRFTVLRKIADDTRRIENGEKLV